MEIPRFNKKNRIINTFYVATHGIGRHIHSLTIQVLNSIINSAKFKIQVYIFSSLGYR